VSLCKILFASIIDVSIYDRDKTIIP